MKRKTDLKKAKKLSRLAFELEENGQIEDAIATYKRAIANAPKWANAYYNLGLAYKKQRDWEHSLKYNKKATELDPKEGDPAWWNLGIAATALKKWSIAKKAWEGFGMTIPNKTGEEIRMTIGITPVRLVENREVVWVKRIDPTRGIIENIPTRESKRRFGDIVLHDGAPNGERNYEGQKFHVFDEIEIWESSTYQTYAIWVKNASRKDLDLIRKVCAENNVEFANWTGTIRRICKKCSEGTPHEHHDNLAEKNIESGEYHLAFALENSVSFDDLLIKIKAVVKLQITDKERII